MTSVPLAALLRDRMTELHPSTFLIRRAALLDGIGLVDEEIPGSYAEDYEFLLRAARSAPLLNLPTPYVLVHWHKRSYFSGGGNHRDALQWLLDRYPEFGTQPRGEARVAGQIAFARAAAATAATPCTGSGARWPATCGSPGATWRSPSPARGASRHGAAVAAQAGPRDLTGGGGS